MNNPLRLSQIAGYCPEIVIWKMVSDLCDAIQGKESGSRLITPDTIVVDGDMFYITPSDSIDPIFLPPEYAEGAAVLPSHQVWMIGAAIYYASSNRILFGGHGSRYQRECPNVRLPALQKVHQMITPVMQRCLQYDPSKRIESKELKTVAQREWERCRREPRPQIELPNEVIRVTPHDQKWPEAMITL